MSGRQRDSLFACEDAETTVCEHTIRVAFESGADAEFDYEVPNELWPVACGQRIRAPFGKCNKIQVGFCVEVDPLRQDSERGFVLKAVSAVVDKEPLLDGQLLELAKWISDYYVCPLGQVLAAMVPAAVKKGAGVKTQQYAYLADQAADVDRQLRGQKQKGIVNVLRQRNALKADCAVAIVDLMAEVGCGGAPIRSLAEKQIVRIARRTTFSALPAIPETAVSEARDIELNEDQRKGLSHISSQIESGGFGVTLLHGVTDSGKTELYIRAIQHVLRKGKTAIVLLPEIALTAQTVQRFSSRFDNIAVMHSGLSAPQRNVQWQAIKSGQANVVIGARSAIFAPLVRLGLIVVDEEHEPSYKQDTAPRYHGRDVAIKRAQLAGAHCILGSATPSLESLLNSRTKKHFSVARLPKRVMDLPMPQMRLVDMSEEPATRQGVELISRPLAERLQDVLDKKEQAIFLLNRRGYSSFIFCGSCKHTLRCRNCDVTLTFHKSDAAGHDGFRTITGRHIGTGYAICHYCFAQTLVPENCPVCNRRMMMIGLGSQRLEEELTRRFPQARIKRVDSDSMAGKDYYRVLREFGQGGIDVLAGTQMIAKGLHFPNVTLVGIISADTSLYLPDFRANERTFQLIQQVAGRAGRSAKKGVVYVQTFLPSQPAIQFALKGDYEGFVREEMKHRKACNLPPFWRLALTTMRDMNFERLESASKAMRGRIDDIIGRSGLKLIVRGPMPAAISRLQRHHRMQIIIQAQEATILQELFSALRKTPGIRPAVKVAIDVDPIDLL